MAVTDEELRADLEEGLSAAQIARKHGVTRQAMSSRVKRMGLTTTGIAVVAPDESREFVKGRLDAMEVLTTVLSRTELLMDACDAWLRDADDPERYDIGPRGDDVTVTYWEAAATAAAEGEREMVKRKATLQELIARVERGGICTLRHDVKMKDPRDLILATAQEIRQTVTLGVQLAQSLSDARAMEVFRSALLAEIERVDPAIAQRIAEAVRRFLILSAVGGGSDAVPAA